MGVRDVISNYNPKHTPSSFASVSLNSGTGPEYEDAESEGETVLEDYTQTRFLVIASLNTITPTSLQTLLSPILSDPKIPIYTLPIPLTAPTSQFQASRWSTTYWPTVYKKTNAFGPHPSLYARAQEVIEGEAGKWMTLAEHVAMEAGDSGGGERVGVVIVERGEGGVGLCVAVAGDARWVGGKGRGKGSGNVAAHAAMRGIGIVCEGLRLADQPSPLPSSSSTIFHDTPLTSLEHTHNIPSSRSLDGYLCHNLEIYSTHEPCVMCSMAIVHSRFAKVVFGRRMERTGGMGAERDGLGLGLWWRKELNWSLLAWQWVKEDEREGDMLDEGLNA